ncbi:hypothetical protein BGK67_33720 [Streptomyces subrutilus]|uniref:Uncharacterized protein n=2 Tax=Streptomyces subrutilus TaxID=36818 RepID=A0A1E5P094_9ACTN|nr:hypothetical protein BGK67_33720 [Streptomyces subrutilus]
MQLMMDPALPPEAFGALVAAMVSISETAGMIPGSTASARWPQQRRLALGEEGALGLAEYVIVLDADPPHILMTHVLLY